MTGSEQPAAAAISLVPVPRKPLRANSVRARLDDRRAAILGAQALTRRCCSSAGIGHRGSLAKTSESFTNLLSARSRRARPSASRGRRRSATAGCGARRSGRRSPSSRTASRPRASARRDPRGCARRRRAPAARARSRATSADEPTWSPIAVRSPCPSGGVCVTRMSMPSGIAAKRPARSSSPSAMKTPPRPRGGQCGTTAPSGQRRRGRLRLVGLRPHAPARAPRRAVDARAGERRLGVVQERPRQPLEDAAIPPPGEVAVARDADDRSAGGAPRPPRARARRRRSATAPGSAPPSTRTGARSPAITTRSQGGTTTPSRRPCRSASAATRTADRRQSPATAAPSGRSSLSCTSRERRTTWRLNFSSSSRMPGGGAEQLREVQDRHVELAARPASRPSAATRRARGGRAGRA